MTVGRSLDDNPPTTPALAPTRRLSVADEPPAANVCVVGSRSRGAVVVVGADTTSLRVEDVVTVNLEAEFESLVSLLAATERAMSYEMESSNFRVGDGRARSELIGSP